MDDAKRPGTAGNYGVQAVAYRARTTTLRAPRFIGIFVDELPKCDTQRCGIELDV